MVSCFDLINNLLDFSVLVNDKSYTCCAPVFLPEHGFLYPRAILLMNLMVFVSNQSEGELLIGYEFLVRLLAICTDAYDLVPCLLEGLIVIS